MKTETYDPASSLSCNLPCTYMYVINVGVSWRRDTK